LLRYIADVGDDGEPGSLPDPCAGFAYTLNCGNYFYSAGGGGLQDVFKQIASRIFTRLTQ
jgi:hypothetical protein